MANAREMNELLRLLLEGSIRLIGRKRVWVSKLDYITGEQNIVSPESLKNGPTSRQPGEGITGKALEKGTPLRIDDVHTPEWASVYFKRWDDTKSELATPIILNNTEVLTGSGISFGSKPIGVLNIESPSIKAFSKVDEHLLWSLALQAALAYNRIEVGHKLAQLTEFQEDILINTDWDDILLQTVHSIASTLELEYVNIALVDQYRNLIQS